MTRRTFLKAVGAIGVAASVTYHGLAKVAGFTAYPIEYAIVDWTAHYWYPVMEPTLYQRERYTLHEMQHQIHLPRGVRPPAEATWNSSTFFLVWVDTKTHQAYYRG